MNALSPANKRLNGKQFAIFQLVLLFLIFLITFNAFAWDHSIELGYGRSQDTNHTQYNNTGFLLSGDIFPIYRSALTFWTLNGALGQWQTTAPGNKNVTTAALSAALRFYLLNIDSYYPPYLLGAVGPAYLSNRQFGENSQGSNMAFQTNLGLGVEFDNIDINLRYVHFSNGGLSSPNQGYNILYVLSIGYLF